MSRTRRPWRWGAAAALAAWALAPARAQDSPSPDADAPKSGPFRPPPTLAARQTAAREAATRAVIAGGLEWLRRHESDGWWSTSDFSERCVAQPACTGPGFGDLNVTSLSVTPLAALAFLGTGQTHREGPDSALIARALTTLRQSQDREGRIGLGPRWLFQHVLATTALAEALWLTGDETLRPHVERARDALVAARMRSDDYGWDYDVGFHLDDVEIARFRRPDAALTIYAVVALRTCDLAGVSSPDLPYVAAAAYLSRRDVRDTRVWVRPPPPPQPEPPRRPAPNGVRDVVASEPRSQRLWTLRDAPSLKGWTHYKFHTPWAATTAGRGLAFALIGGSDHAAALRDVTAAVVATPPVGQDGVLDLHCGLWGSLLLAQRPSQEALSRQKAFRDGVVREICAKQRPKSDGCAAGSWDPELDPFGVVGGRVYSTATALLVLQAPYRFPRVWSADARPRRR